MPFENGGRADKFGNKYESCWVVKQLLRLLNEEIYSLVIEPIGKEEEGVDLWITNKDGSKECHQVKARNASKEYWTFGDLESKDIFEKTKKQLDFNKDASYYLVSAVASVMLNDLTKRARNSNGNSGDFYKYQIENSGKKVKSSFKKFARYFDLDITTINGQNQAYEY